MKNKLKTEFRTRVQNKITQDSPFFMIMVTCLMSIIIWIYIHKTFNARGLLAPAPLQSPANALGCDIIAAECGLAGRKLSAPLQSYVAMALHVTIIVCSCVMCHMTMTAK
jgi:hypothetical protein